MKTLQTPRSIISILPHCCSASTEGLFPLKHYDLAKSQNAKLKTCILSKHFISRYFKCSDVTDATFVAYDFLTRSFLCGYGIEFPCDHISMWACEHVK